MNMCFPYRVRFRQSPLLRGGDRCAYKRMSRYVRQDAAGGGQTACRNSGWTSPGRAEFKLAIHYLIGAAAPPRRRGKSLRVYLENSHTLSITRFDLNHFPATAFGATSGTCLRNESLLTIPKTIADNL